MKIASSPPEPEAGPAYLQLENVARAIALVLSNQVVYGRQHRLTEESFQEGFEYLAGYLNDCGTLLLGTAQGHLVANSRYIELRTRNLQTLAQSLEERDVAGLEFQPGTTAHELHAVLDILSTPPVTVDGYGGVGAMLQGKKVDNIRLSEARYEKLLDDEMVVSARQASSKNGYRVGDPDQDSATLLAYLDHDSPEAAEKASCAVGGLASDAHLIAEIIFQAATSKSGDGLGGCDFDVLADCVRKVTDVITSCPAAGTAGGRLMLIGTLDDLKEELLFSIQTDDGDSEFAQKALGQIIENSKERLSVEKLFAEYAQKRALLDSRERRIVDYLRNKGFGLTPAELEQRLKRQGISHELWQELWDKSFRRTAQESEDQSSGAVVRFENFAKNPPKRTTSRSSDYLDQLINNMADVELEMVSLVEHTRVRVDAMGQIFGKALSSPTGPSRDHLLELARMLIQIGHGLSEPIKMLNTSVEIVRSSHLGRLNEAQHAVLQMAAISGQRLQSLTNQLMAIAEANQT